jgi:hypothetical protein
VKVWAFGKSLRVALSDSGTGVAMRILGYKKEVGSCCYDGSDSSARITNSAHGFWQLDERLPLIWGSSRFVSCQVCGVY